MKKHVCFLSSMLISLCAFQASADNVYYVSPSGDDANAGTLEAPFKTVAKAINSVTTADPTTIYLESDAEFKEANLTTAATRANLTVIGENTTINANGNKQRILRTEAETLTLKGITFKGVEGYDNIGGVLYFAGNSSAASSLVIDNCVFEGNSLSSNSTATGGAAIATGANAINISISNSVFRNNALGNTAASTSGAVIHYQGKNGTMDISKCLFAENTTASSAGAMILGFSTDCQNVQALLTNNVFYNNTIQSVPTGSVPNVLVRGKSNVVAMVNNTFYFDLRDTDPGEETGDQERVKKIYKRTSAVNILNEGNNTLHFVNNVASGMRNAVISAGTTNRTIHCHNNYAAVMEPHVYVSELTDGENGNRLVTAREANVGDPFLADIESLNVAMSGVGMDNALTAASVPYLATQSGSPLIDAGINTYSPSGVELVPQTDIAGNARSLLVDIGAYEVVGSADPTLLPSSATDDMASICRQAGQILIRNYSGQPLTARIVLPDGRTPVALVVGESATISTADLPHGVALLTLDNGAYRTTKKIIL